MFGLNDRSSNGTGSWWIKVRQHTAKLTNVLVTGFGERCNLVRESKLVFESDEQEFSLRGVKSKKISSHTGRDLLKSVLKVGNAWVKVEWVEREEQLSVICIKVEYQYKYHISSIVLNVFQKLDAYRLLTQSTRPRSTLWLALGKQTFVPNYSQSRSVPNLRCLVYHYKNIVYT